MHFEERAHGAAGPRYRAVWKFPVRDASGAITGIGMVASDITDRRLTEQELRDQRALLAEAQKLAGLGCWEWDPESGRRGVVRRALPHLRRDARGIHAELRGVSRARASRGSPALRRHDGASADGRPRLHHARAHRAPRGRGALSAQPGRGGAQRAGQADQGVRRLPRCHRAAPLRDRAAPGGAGPASPHAPAWCRPRRPSAGASRASCTTASARALSALNINLDIIARDDTLAPASRQRLHDSVGPGRQHAAVDRRRDGRAAPAAARRVRPRRRARLARGGVLAAHRHSRERRRSARPRRRRRCAWRPRSLSTALRRRR